MTTVRCPPTGCLVVDRDNAHSCTYLARVPVSHTLEQVLSPEYFGLQQTRRPQDKNLREGDFIDVQPEDYRWYARLMVRACVPTVDQVVTDVLYQKSFAVDGLPAGWEMEHKGAQGWCIFFEGREKDAGFRTPEAARARINYFVAQGLVGQDEPAAVTARGRTKKTTEGGEGEGGQKAA